MIEMLRDEVSPTKIKVIGVGGGGCNAVNWMVQSNIQQVEFIAANTDAHALSISKANQKIVLGEKVTRGLGAGSNPEIGELSALEDKEKVANMLRETDMVFVTAGMGGGTGTGAAPIIADIAKDLNALTVAVVTKPFRFEGKKKMEIAEKGIEKLINSVDTLIIIPNQNLLDVTAKEIPAREAFHIADDVLRQAVQGISDIITIVGIINVDFADVRTVMKDAGNAVMGIGVGQGQNRAADAAHKAIANPLLESNSIEGARGVLVNVTGGNDLTLHEYDEIVSMITNNCDKDAMIIAGMAIDNSLNDEVRVTLIATGFKDSRISTASAKSFGTVKPKDIQLMDSNYSEPISKKAVVNGDFDSLLPIEKELKPDKNVRQFETKHIKDDLENIPTFLRKTKN